MLQIFLGATFIRFSIVMFHTVFISSNPWRANRMYRFLGCTCPVFYSIDIQNMVIGFVQKRKLVAVTGAKKRVKMQTFSKGPASLTMIALPTSFEMNFVEVWQSSQTHKFFLIWRGAVLMTPNTIASFLPW
jgi:hypothetical protein